LTFFSYTVFSFFVINLFLLYFSLTESFFPLSVPPLPHFTHSYPFSAWKFLIYIVSCLQASHSSLIFFLLLLTVLFSSKKLFSCFLSLFRFRFPLYFCSSPFSWSSISLLFVLNLPSLSFSFLIWPSRYEPPVP
jgi:hypothetical protein